MFKDKTTKQKIHDYQNNIPAELTLQKNWVLWKLENRKGKTTKVPYNAETLKGAQSNNSKTWSTFKQAIQALKDHSDNFTGIGFMFSSPYVGLDIDHVSKQDPKKIDQVLQLVKGTYIERSQSGDGYHAIFKGKKPTSSRNKREPFELYDHGRFFALTADVVKSPKKLIQLNNDQINKLIELTVGYKESIPVQSTSTGIGNNLTPIEVIKKASNSKHGKEFIALMNGDQLAYPSQSNADLALCNMLAYWTAKDPDKMDEIVRNSKAYRPKWDEKHGAQTYAQMTIQKAIAGTKNVYQPSKQSNNKSVPNVYGFNQNQPQGNVLPLYAANGQTSLSSSVKLIRNDKGAIKASSSSNCVAIIRNDPNLSDLFRFNEFTQTLEIAKDRKIDLRSKSLPIIKFKKGNLQDYDVINVGIYIQACKNWENTIFKKDVLFDAVASVAKDNGYNPITQYFNEAYNGWDKKNRLDNFFVTYLGADQNETTSLITELWFLGGVAKAKDPYAKFDFVLDLVGEQGTGKTVIAHKIAPLDMYTDSMITFHKPDDLAIMKNAFIVNDDEMAVTNSEGFEATKKFITDLAYTYRPPYARIPITVPHHFIMMRTTNQMSHLKDSSGDRRFMTILVHKKQQKKNPIKLTDEYIKQVWGEACHLYKNMEDSGINPFELTKKQEKLLLENRKQFRYTTVLMDDLQQAIDDNFHNAEVVTMHDLAKAMFDDEFYFSNNRKTGNKIKTYMEELGYEWKHVKVNGKVMRAFKKS